MNRHMQTPEDITQWSPLLTGERGLTFPAEKKVLTIARNVSRVIP